MADGSRVFHTDSGILNGAFVIYGDTVQHIVEPGWRKKFPNKADPATCRQLNGIMRRYSTAQLADMSGNRHINESVYTMNVWYY
jgi:hypothetical protein